MEKISALWKKYRKKISSAIRKASADFFQFGKRHRYKIAIGAAAICVLAATGVVTAKWYIKDRQALVRNAETTFHFGAIGDFEYGTRNKVGNKLTRQAKTELEKVVRFYNTQYDPIFAIELGDMVESSGQKREKTLQQFRDIDAIFRGIDARTEYVLGNHDLRALSKEDVRMVLGLEDNHRYFDEGDWRFVIMDTNFDPKRDGADMGPNHYVSGYVPPRELDWLEMAITTDRPTVVFSHHPIASHEKNTRNYKEVRAVFERHPNVALSVSGHEPAFRFSESNGIHYLVVDNLANKDSLGSFATLNLFYNPFTKEARAAVEHYGPTRRTVEAKKIISADREWWVDMFDQFGLLP